MIPRPWQNWLVERADPDSIQGNLEVSVHFWASDQPNACGEWLHEIGLGPETDRAVEAYTLVIGDHDAPSAFAWAQSITDVDKRASTIEEVSRRFYRFDPKGFLATVSTSPLPASESEALVGMVKRQAEFR